jgi:hypothetical protein
MGPTNCGRRRAGPATTSAGTRWPASCARPAFGASKRGRRVITTKSDDSAARSPDLVKRNFTAERPNGLVGHGSDVCADEDPASPTSASSSTPSAG